MKSLGVSTAASLVGLLLVCQGCSKSSGPEVTVTASPAQLAEIQSWPEEVVCFTSTSNPIKSLDELDSENVAAWGGELLPGAAELLELGGREKAIVGMQIIGTGNDSAKFNNNPELRLFVTYERFAQQIINGGGIRVTFVSE